MGNQTSNAVLKNASEKSTGRFYGFHNVRNDHEQKKIVVLLIHFVCVQFGNTCYCNSVLQTLFHCAAFRKRIRRFADGNATASCLCVQLANLFDDMCTMKSRTGVVSPSDFLRELTKANETFREGVQQDAQEFLNFLLNSVSERARQLDKGARVGWPCRNAHSQLTRMRISQKLKSRLSKICSKAR